MIPDAFGVRLVATMQALIDSIEADGLADPLLHPLTLGCVLTDLCRLAEVPLPPWLDEYATVAGIVAVR